MTAKPAVPLAAPVLAEPTVPRMPPPLSAPAEASAPTAPKPATAVHIISAALDAEITGLVNMNDAFQIGVALTDLREGLVHRYGVEEPFAAASTAKVLAAAAYYHLVETGGARPWANPWVTSPPGSSSGK